MRSACRPFRNSRLAFEELDADSKIKGVVFTGYDGALSGADVNEFTSLNTREETEGICYKAHPVQKVIANMKKPVVAAVNGPVMGGGAEFCMACHARVVGPNLIFAQPEVNLGIMPGYGATQRLPRLVGVEQRAGTAAHRDVPSGPRKPAPSDGLPANRLRIRSARPRISSGDHIAGKVKLATVNPAPIAVPDPIPDVDLGHRSLLIDAILVNAVKQGLQAPARRRAHS